MAPTGSDLNAELRVSPGWAIAAVFLAGLIFASANNPGSDPSEWVKVLSLAALFYLVGLTTWLLDSWRTLVGRWVFVIGLTILIYLGIGWLGMPGFLSLVVLPTALAAAMISLPAAIAVALGQSVVLLLLPSYAVTGVDLMTIVMTIVAIWATLGLMMAVYRPMYQVVRRSWEDSQRAQDLLEESRDRKAELEQALKELMRTNWELDLLNERLAAMRLAAEEAQKTKAAFVARVSHEFRTPLNMIIGLTDLLLETPEVYGEELPPPLLEDMKIVHRNCEHLSSMINDVLDLSQTEAGHLALHREWVDLTEDIDVALTAVRPLLEKKQLYADVVSSNDLPQVYCDRTRIRQVILNLISNAARYTEKGGITLGIAQQGQDIIVSVADTGPGIPPDDAARIFEPFCQGSGNGWSDQSGTGLGLSISKQFIELHKGRIWLESKVDVGSTFSFSIPVSPPTRPPTRPVRWIGEDWVWTERTAKPQVPRLPFKQRIVVCDEANTLHPLSAFWPEEVEFVETKDLDQALQEIEQCPAHAVILNTDAPDNLWPRVRKARLEIPDTPIVGCSFPPPPIHPLDAGVADYLIKPVTLEKLAEAIRAVGSSIKRVLVVDDNPDVQKLLTRMLISHEKSMEVVAASNGEQALAELRQRPPDVMLLDIMLPDMDGWQILRLKNEDETIKGIPTIIVSAQDPMGHMVESKVLLMAMGQGLSMSRLLRCSLELSTLLLKPD
jgi:signal transduction histidine kinase/DNA-binding response OmpR family regulator